MAKWNDAELAASFDRRLARRDKQRFPTGKSNSARTGWQNPANIAAGTVGNRTRISVGTVNLKAPTKKAYNRQFSSNSGKGAVAAFKANINKVFDDATKQIIERQNTERAIELAKNLEPKNDPGVFDKIMDTVKAVWSQTPGVSEVTTGRSPGENYVRMAAGEDATGTGVGGENQGFFESFQRSPAGRAMDIISRPFYGAQAFMQGTLQADYAGEDFWQSLGHGLREGASGLAGTEKKGFGDVLNTYLEGSKSAPAEAFRGFEAKHPEAAQWAQRAGGLIGDITTDPLKSIHPGSATILASTGERATESTVKNAVRQVVDTAARDAIDDVRLSRPKGMFRPSTNAIAERVVSNVEDRVNRSLLEVSRGGRGGFTKIGNEAFAQSIANDTAEQVRRGVLEPFEKRLDDLIQPIEAGRTPNITQIRSHIARNPEFTEMLDNLETRLGEKGRVYDNVTDMVSDLSSRDLPLIKRAASDVRANMGHYWQTVADDVYAGTRDFTYNTVSVKLPTGGSVPLKTVGKVWKAIKEAKVDTKISRDLGEAAKHISFEHNFPGRVSLMTQRARSLGIENFESFRDDLAKIAREYTPEQAREIQSALDEGRVLTGKLEVARQHIETAYKDIMAEEIAKGVRPANAKWAEDYAFVYNKGGSKEARVEFKEGRKKAIKKSPTGNRGPYGMQYAIKKGLKPVDNAFEALLARKMKSSRDLTRTLFLKDLVDNYGIMARDLSPAEIAGRRLRRINPDELDNTWRGLVKKTGEQIYLPEAHDEMFKIYKELSSFDPRGGGRTLRAFNKMTSMLKWASTVPRPGFHIRNMIGDYWMGLLDNVPTRTYSEVASKWEAWKTMGKMPRFRITKNISHSIEDMWGLYQHYANTGFFETELEHAGVSTGGKGLAGKVLSKARDASEARENYGRFTHFVAAYRQEAQELVAKGMKEGPRLEEKALEAAVWRVNHYKFDYNALTAFERRVKLAFPFYTFTRKATPTLLESLLISPHYMGTANRFMQLHDGSAADAFNSYYLPDYVKDVGFSVLNQDSPEPFFLRGDILPTNTLNNVDFTNSQEFAQSITQQANPMLQVPFELATQKVLFNNRPTGNALEYALNKLPVGMNVAREVQNTGGEPGWLARVNNTFTGLGLPIEQFTKARQDQGFRAAEDRFIQDPIYDFNRNHDQFQVFVSNTSRGEQSFKVKYVPTGEIVYEDANPRKALQYAKQLSGD